MRQWWSSRLWARRALSPLVYVACACGLVVSLRYDHAHTPKGTTASIPVELAEIVTAIAAFLARARARPAGAA